MNDSGLLSFGVVGRRPVFMDERHDSYFLLEKHAEAEFLELMENDDTLGNASAGLRSALGPSSTPPQIIFARPPKADRSILEETGSAPAARVGDALRVAWLLRRARRAIVKRPIGEILFGLGRSFGTERLDGLEIVAAAKRFITARRLVPYPPNCLTDSLALVQWLGRSSALLVFGVKLEPFAAHCWVQAGDLLLNDQVETVAQFRAVRVIECATR